MKIDPRELQAAFDGYTHVVHYTYRQWIGKPDPSGFGRARFFTSDPKSAAARFASQGHRVNRTVKIKVEK